MKKISGIYLTFILAFTLSLTVSANSRPTPLAGLEAWATVTRDTSGIAHISSLRKHDMFFLQGYIHAGDRLLQMDISRRQGSGTLAELLGPAALATDIELRTIGVRRAAIRSFDALSDDIQDAIRAYSEGVNAYVASHPLPSTYAALELSEFKPWEPIDSVVIGKLIALNLSFDTGDIDRTLALVQYQATGAANGFDGSALFFEDVFRAAPFDSASTVPDADGVLTAIASAGSQSNMHEKTPAFLPSMSSTHRVARLGKQYLSRIKDIPFFQALREDNVGRGSNEWAVSGSLTTSGFPMIANDPHLQLDTPSIFYPIQLRTFAGINTVGNSFAGVPGIVQGHNRFISWGVTTNGLDVTDIFQEQIVPDPTSPSGLSSVYQGQLEPVVPIPQAFFVNQRDNGVLNSIVAVPPGGRVPEATLIIPRRNMGPIVEIDRESGIALSVQYTGFSATREMEAFIRINEAHDLDSFKHALTFFDVGSQNFAYSDTRGNIAYFSSAELPLREDLQSGVVNGMPPWFIRDGTGGNEWLAVETPAINQALPYAILPFEEMPQTINPANGWFVNANNDPAGTTLDNNSINQFRQDGGIYYLSPGYARGFRAGRITQLIREKLTSGDRKISFQEMEEIQNDVVLLDAQFFVPFILNAMNNAKKPDANETLARFAQDAALSAAVVRLQNWDFSTPTGISEGYDAVDNKGELSEPSTQEIAASIATTIYSVWRGRIIRHTTGAVLDRFGLRRPGSSLELTGIKVLLENFDNNLGVGASGLDFFAVPDIAAAADRRDIIILQSLADALDRLSGEPFAGTFNFSSNQNDYRWGKLHRVVFDSPLGAPFSIPSAGTDFPPPLEGFSGIPTDGGFGVVDASSHSAAADGENSYMYSSGPVNRYVSEQNYWRGIKARSIWPGGISGILGDPNYFNLLPDYLTNDRVPLFYRTIDVRRNAQSRTVFIPKRR